MRGKKSVLSLLLVLVLFLFLCSSFAVVVFAAVPPPPTSPTNPADSILNERDPSTASTTSTPSSPTVIGSGSGSGGNYTPKKVNSTKTAPKVNSSDGQNTQSGDTATNNDVDTIDDETVPDDSSTPPETQGPASNFTITIILFITGIFVVVAIFLLVKNVLRDKKKPVLPSIGAQSSLQSPFGSSYNNTRPVADIRNQSVQQPAMVRTQRMIQPSSIPATQSAQPIQSFNGSRPPIQNVQQSNIQQSFVQRPAPVQQVDANTKSLAEYLSNSFRAGHTLQTLQSTLSSSGWTDDDVRKAMDYLKGGGGR